MKIITWNVNSIRVRLPLMEHLIENYNPDVILLQETKCTDEHFPYDFFASYSYHAAVHGQKTYNGVAILSKNPIENIQKNLDDSPEARYIEGVTSGIHVSSAYVPCGNKSTESYEYKQTFMQQIASRWKSFDGKLLVGGDFNVAMNDQDIQTPKKWVGSVLCTPEVRNSMASILDTNLRDLYENIVYENDNDNENNSQPTDKKLFTWWDYRRPYEGLRIDYILGKNVTGQLMTLQQYRKMERPSDHVPVMFMFDV